MDKNHAINAVIRFGKVLEDCGIKLSKLILFGSYATGTQREGSDIDVVVVSDGFKNMGYWERIDIMSKAICKVWEPIEATAYTPEEWAAGTTTICEYAKNGELIAAAAL
jgi:predicted nucleotidyltransferase